MMDIHNSIKACIFRISDKFCNTAEPSLVNLVFRSIANVAEPGDRNADCIESGGRFQRIYS